MDFFLLPLMVSSRAGTIQISKEILNLFSIGIRFALSFILGLSVIECIVNHRSLVYYTWACYMQMYSVGVCIYFVMLCT